MSMALEPGAYRAMLLTSGVSVLLLAACAAKAPRPPGPGAVFVVDEPAPTIEPAAPTGLDPVAASAEVAPRALYVPWEAGDEKGATMLRVERTPPTAEGADGVSATWKVRRILVAPDGTESPQSDETFVLTSDGSVALAESIDHAESVEVVFEPPMVAVPAGMLPGSVFTQKVRMTVYPIGSDRSRPQTSGDASQRVTYVGDERIRTPAPGPDGGAWGARHLRSSLAVQLGPAQVTNELDQWFVDGVGIVSEQRHERTNVLGVPLRNNLERWAMLSAELGGEWGELAGALRTRGTPGPARPAPGSPAAASSPPSWRSGVDTPPPATSPSPPPGRGP